MSGITQEALCSWPGCGSRLLVDELMMSEILRQPRREALILGAGQQSSGNWVFIYGKGFYCDKHWHVDEATNKPVSGPQEGGPSGTTPPPIERLGSETDLYYAVITRTDPAHAEEVFDQYAKILREVRSQAWKLGYAGGKAGFDPAANPYQDEEES